MHPGCLVPLATAFLNAELTPLSNWWTDPHRMLPAPEPTR